MLQLGKTENQIQNLQDRTITETTRTESSVIEILELWQKVFRETFHQYHRLSTRLVKSQDSAIAFRLWQEYLTHVQAFLQSSIPDDYHGLTEHQRLCQVHQNLLSTQKDILAERTEASEDEIQADQFLALTDAHRATLFQIENRHNEVTNRISAWDRYRTDQTKLLAWLKDMEKERSRLQLRYIHVRRVPKVLTRIQSLLDRVPAGEEQAHNLQRQQDDLLRLCDDALATSVRMEYSAIMQRISNLQAALQTWKQFLIRIEHLSSSYDQRVDSIQNLFHDIQRKIAANPTDASRVQDRLEELRTLRIRVSDVIHDLEDLGVTQEELKECVSPSDMKTINQRLWLLTQQQGDLEHQLATLCHQLEETSGLGKLFETRQARFMVWAKDLEGKLDERDSGIKPPSDPEEVLKRLESEIQAEMSLKNREVEWLLSTGRRLIDGAEPDESRRISLLVDAVSERWRFLQNRGKNKAGKLHDIIQTMSQLQIRIAEIRAWLHQTEVKLAAPLTLETATEEDFEEKLREHDDLRRTIEKESSNVAEVLNLCEVLINDADTWKVHFSVDTLASATDGLEKRWKAVCGISAERKRKLMSAWQLLNELLRLSNQREKWVKEQEEQLEKEDATSVNLTEEQIQAHIHNLERRLRELNSMSATLEVLEQTYSKLMKTSGLEHDRLQKLTASVKILMTRWKALEPRAQEILSRLLADLALYEEFRKAHGRAVVSLTQVDINLTQLQHLQTPEEAPQNALQQLKVTNITTCGRLGSFVVSFAESRGGIETKRGTHLPGGQTRKYAYRKMQEGGSVSYSSID